MAVSEKGGWNKNMNIALILYCIAISYFFIAISYIVIYLFCQKKPKPKMYIKWHQRTHC